MINKINHFNKIDLERCSKDELRELYLILKYAPTTNYKHKMQLSKLLNYMIDNNIEF